MTQAQECLDKLCRNCMDMERCHGKCGAKRVLQALVNKDKPEKVIYERKVGYISGHFIDLPICPSCGIIFSKEVELNQSKYCPKCGQHLIWEFKR